MCTVQLYRGVQYTTLAPLWPETLVNGCRIPVLRVTTPAPTERLGGEQLEAGEAAGEAGH